MTSDVLIVGAGPTGLLLAGLLARNLRVRIIERRPATSRESKAIALNAMSLHLLDNEQLLGRVAPHASRLESATIWWENRRQTRIQLSLLDSPYNHFLLQPQFVTEQGLESLLAERGVSVERCTELLEVSQTEDHAVARLRHADGREEQVAARYVVGCDGSHSRVRKDAGISFTGHTYDMHFVLGDLALNWPGLGQGAHYMIHEDTFIVIVPLGPPGCARVLVKKDGQYSKAHDPDLSEIVEVLARVGPPDLVVTEAFWLSHAPFYMRLAERARVGRLLLAGDSLHLFSPIGVMGMNTGLHDVFNLAWKLPLACRNEGAAETLLTSYEQERLPIARATAAQTDRSTRLISRIERRPSETEEFLPKPKNRRIWKTVFPERYSGIAVTYGESPALEHATDSACTGVGRINPLAPLLRRWLLEQSPQPSAFEPFQLLAFVRDREQHAEWLRILQATAHLGPYLVTVAVFDPTSSERSASSCPCLPEELANPLRRALDARWGEVFVVRPDTYVGLRAPMSSVNEVSTYLASLIGEESPSVQDAPSTLPSRVLPLAHAAEERP